MEGSTSSRRRMAGGGSVSGRRREAESGNANGSIRRSISSMSTRSVGATAERTVKRLRLSKALTVPENTMLSEACRRMASRRVDALLLTDSNALLCGILTAKDIATRVIARELKLEETPASRVMTRNPIFVLSETLAVEALQKMVQGKFRHLPVVDNGEVVAILDIAKCLYDAIARLERASEKGKAIAAAVEGVEKHWGTSGGPNTFLETLRERMFKPTLSTIIPENPKVAMVTLTDSVLTATKKMLEYRLSSVVVAVENKPLGILTSRDILMRVIAQNLPPESTIAEKIMTPNPQCGTVDTPIVDALHTMHVGKFLHLPVVDKDGSIVHVVDVIHITHAAVATIGSSGALGNETPSTMMQKFWDSALTLGPTDDDGDSVSEGSYKMAPEGSEIGRSTSFQSSLMPNTFAFKLEDNRGRMHRFICDTRSLTEVITSILQRVGDDIDQNHLPQILYEDEDRDKVILASDDDLVAAVEHAKLVGWKCLKLYLDNTGSSGHRRRAGAGDIEFAQKDAWMSAYKTVAAGAALVAGFGFMAYLKKSGS